MGGQVVDTQSAEEFMRETLENVSRDELTTVAALLDAKAAGFAALLGSPGPGPELSRDDLRRVLRSVFATRRKADAILDDVGPEPPRRGDRRPDPRPRRRHRPLRRLRRGDGRLSPTPASTCRRSCSTSPSPTAGGCGPGGCGTPGPAPAPCRW